MSTRTGVHGLRTPVPAGSALAIPRVRRLLRKLERLLGQPDRAADPVHAIRVTIKKLRAWIRLLRHGAGRRHLRRSDRALRELAKSLAGQRDLAARKNTLVWLQQRCNDPELAAHLALLARQEPAVATVVPVEPLALPPGLASALLTHPPSARELARGLAHSRAALIRSGRKATRPGARARQLHAWRKQVKCHGYQLEIACTDKLGIPAPIQAELDALGKVLGLVQDLTVLRKYLQSLQADPALSEAAATVRILAAVERAALTRQAGVQFAALQIHTPAPLAGAT